MRKRHTPRVSKREKPAARTQQRPTEPAPAAETAIAWYCEADWRRARALFPDAHELHDTYSGWLKSADDAMKAIKSAGLVPRPFIIDLDDFLVWCAVRGRQRTAQDRTDYATEKLRLEGQK